jgi:hypothetical protein
MRLTILGTVAMRIVAPPGAVAIIMTVVELAVVAQAWKKVFYFSGLYSVHFSANRCFPRQQETA